MSRFLIISSLFFGAFSLLSVIWILIPAPSYYVWLYSVAVSEWSLWLGAIALIGIALALWNYAFYESGGMGVIALVVGILAFLISLYPLLTMFQTAHEKQTSLSIGQYLGGLTNQKSTNQFNTYVFKQIGETQLKMDVYPPPETSITKRAAIIVIHGGSWNAGNRNDFPQWNEWLAANGFTVFDIDYTLIQPNYQTAVGDVKCAIRYVKEHSIKFNISPDKIVLLGRSAGGHLALLAAYSANDKRLPATCSENKTDEGDDSVRAVVSLYAPTNLVWAFDNPANKYVINGAQTLTSFIGGGLHESEEMRARFMLVSPVERVNTNSPPTLLIHGEQDQLVRPENVNFLSEKLKQNNIAHETLFIRYGQHGFDYNFYGWGSQLTKPLILEFLSKNIEPQT